MEPVDINNNNSNEQYLAENKSPAFQFYPKDYLTDTKVMAMTPEMRGLYIHLLCVDWLNDGFPQNQILRLAGFEWESYSGEVRPVEEIESIKNHLEGCFVSHERKYGYITNPRLAKERAKQLLWREKSSAGGRKSGLIRREKIKTQNNTNGYQDKGGSDLVQTIIEPNMNISSSSSSSSSSSNNINTITPKKPKRIKPTFDPTGKKKYLDWVYLSSEQYERVKSYYQKKGLTPDDFQEAVRELDKWFSDNQHMRDSRVDDAKTLMGWPLDKALQRKANLMRVEQMEGRR